MVIQVEIISKTKMLEAIQFARSRVTYPQLDQSQFSYHQAQAIQYCMNEISANFVNILFGLELQIDEFNDIVDRCILCARDKNKSEKDE